MTELENGTNPSSSFEIPLPEDLGGMYDELSALVQPRISKEIVHDEYGEHQNSYWLGDFEKFDLSEGLERVVGTGKSVDCFLRGDTEFGIAVIFKSSNPGDNEGYGFLVKPYLKETPATGPLSWGYTLLHGPADIPPKNKSSFADYLVRSDTAVEATPEIASEFLSTLRNNVGAQQSKETTLSALFKRFRKTKH